MDLENLAKTVLNIDQPKLPRLTWAELRAHYIDRCGLTAVEIFDEVDRHLGGMPTKADEREERL